MDNKEEEKKEGFVLTDDNIPKFKEPLKPVVVEEKKKSKTPIVIISILLIILLVGGTIFGVKYYMDNTKKTNNNPQDEIDNKEDEEEKEEITLNEVELNEYLSFVPYDLRGLRDAYSGSFTNISSYNKKIFVALALRKYLIDHKISDGNYDEFNNKEVDTFLKEMYNTALDITIFQNSEELFAGVGGVCFYYNNDKFASRDCAGSNPLVKSEITYEAKDDDLYIYEYAAKNYNDTQIINLFTNESFNLNGINSKTYLDTHKPDFTKYKHIFKKNELGYYWYSTEVIK